MPDAGRMAPPGGRRREDGYCSQQRLRRRIRRGGTGVTLQTDRLVMVGLGVQADAPPDNIQPALIDGVHVRWMCDADLGYPWYGFHLYRRPSQDGKPRCLGPSLAGLSLSSPPVAPWATPVGQLDSDVPLSFSDDFAPAARAEVDLRLRQWARLTLPAGQPAYRADVTIGLREDVGLPATKRTCVDFRPDGVPKTGPNPRSQGGAGFTVTGAGDKPAPTTEVRPVKTSAGVLAGLDCGTELRIGIPCPAVEVELILTSLATPARVRAINGAGTTVASAVLTPPAGQTQTAVLSGTGIVEVIVSAPDDATTLHQICYRCPVDSPAGKGIEVVALSGLTPVATAAVTGAAKQVVTVSLRFDQVTAIEVRGGPAALVDICVWFVADGAAAGWQRLPTFPNPMGLPVRHPDYPATGNQTINAAVAEAVGLARIKYGLPAPWQPAFADLHDQLKDLVTGGPSGPTMASKAQDFTDSSDPDVPVQLADESILDLLFFASLNPALAQLLGVYWVDTTAVPGVSYDYLVVADHTGVGQRDAQHVLAVIASAGFAQLDGWICFGLKAGSAAPVSIPTGMEAYSLPDSTAAPDAGGTVAPGHGTVGVRWALPTAVNGGLVPGAPLLYHLWRASLANESTPVGLPIYGLVTTEGPVLPSTPQLPQGLASRDPSDLPPVPLCTLDCGLNDGWYAYAVCGVDLFGRHSARSAAAAWRQWAPAPDPKPWYYIDPPADRVVHPSAVRVLDKTPPPLPPAVEAYALDPDPTDPTVVRDQAYNAWYASLQPAEQPSLVGLRVRWEWTAVQMRQAPDTAEFRIYFSLGSDPPAGDRHDPLAWPERRYVVQFNDANHWTETQTTDGPLRVYEVILPASGDTVRPSLPLEPTLADPIAYGWVGVSAADGQQFTADNPKWAAGNHGNRPGNEGRIGALAKVWRVWRQKPPAPVMPADAGKVFATRADYHSRSYYTFRWPGSTSLRAHVFRSMDETLYRVDWAARPRPALAANQLDHFPDEAVDPRWNVAKRTQVAKELNRLQGFDRTARDGVERAVAYYRGLSDDALRVLAGLPGMDDAFAQLTIEPLDLADRVGPDNPPTYAPSSSLRSYVDTLDGRSTNRYFYRAAYVDPAHNHGPLSLSGPPVYLHKVVPPRSPVITSVTADDLALTVAWARNREPDLAGYRIYRAETETDAADLRSMAMVHAAGPGDSAWTDTSGLVGGHSYFYRLTALDTAGNESPPTRPHKAIAIDTRPPPAPVWVAQTWLLVREVDQLVLNWPAAGAVPDGYQPALRLEWDSATPEPQFEVTRITSLTTMWTAPSNATVEPSRTPPGRFVLLDLAPESMAESWYRLKVRSSTGVWSTEEAVLSVAPPALTL